jgi:hypothetical protein
MARKTIRRSITNSIVAARRAGSTLSRQITAVHVMRIPYK